MCGICFGVRPQPSPGAPFPVAVSHGEAAPVLDVSSVWAALVDAVSTRGPDHKRSLVHTVGAGQGAFELRFHACILHMRGQVLTQQPFTTLAGDVFLWNGEIFAGLPVSSQENDGQVLFDRILQAGVDGFAKAIRDVEGPYAFVYYEAATRRVFYGRDPLGRRSLLLHRPTPISPSFYLTSSGPDVLHPLDAFEEVTCDGIHCFDLGLDGDISLSTLPRVYKLQDPLGSGLIYPFDRLLPSTPSTDDLLPFVDAAHLPSTTPALQLAIDGLLATLKKSVAARVDSPHLDPSSSSVARVAVLFSGGIDCTTLALLADATMAEGETIDLINVAFENPRVLRGNVVLENQTKKAKRALKVQRNASTEDPVPLPAIPVVQVSPASIYDVPDRLTGYDSFEELKRVCPTRRWNFVEVNVTYAEMLEHRGTVLQLMRPTRTVMDLSIAIAFFFAARGQGVATTGHSTTPVPYTSTARILLSGLGADELLGGYARHRKAFNHTSPSLNPWTSLIAELQMDLDRIWTRNLGRDDRIISFHGKEARYPFLAGEVVEYCARTEVWLKCDMRFDESIGDKLLLRKLALRLGLSRTSTLKKRAIHFGARTAKMELDSGRIKGELLL